MLDVGLGIGAGKRGEVKAQTNTLGELYQLRRIQFIVEFGLACKDDAQHLFLGGFHSGEQPNLF